MWKQTGPKPLLLRTAPYTFKDTKFSRVPPSILYQSMDCVLILSFLYQMRERTMFSVSLHDTCSCKDSSWRELVTKSRTTEANSSWCEVYSWSACSITYILWFAMYLPNSMASLTGITLSLEPWTVKTLQNLRRETAEWFKYYNTYTNRSLLSVFDEDSSDLEHVTDIRKQDHSFWI